MNDNENRFLSFFDCINLLREHHLDVSNGRSQEAFFRWHFIKVEELSPSWNILHYYRNFDLSRLGNPFYPSFPTEGQKAPFCSGWQHQPEQKGLPAPRGWRTLLSRLVLATGTKGLLFPCFPFLNSFSISIILLHFNYTNKYKYILICIILVPNI